MKVWPVSLYANVMQKVCDSTEVSPSICEAYAWREVVSSYQLFLLYSISTTISSWKYQSNSNYSPQYLFWLLLFYKWWHLWSVGLWSNRLCNWYVMCIDRARWCAFIDPLFSDGPSNTVSPTVIGSPSFFGVYAPDAATYTLMFTSTTESFKYVTVSTPYIVQGINSIYITGSPGCAMRNSCTIWVHIVPLAPTWWISGPVFWRAKRAC